jgi:uncharacterized protein (DUF302 family)
MDSTDALPPGIGEIPGVVHRRSLTSVPETVERLSELIEGADASIFCVIDQRREAQRVGLVLRETTLIVFGNPASGTPLMEAAPIAALDLPLKILVWADDDGDAWMTYLSPAWLADRYGLSADRARALSATDALTSQLAASS